MGEFPCPHPQGMFSKQFNRITKVTSDLHLPHSSLHLVCPPTLPPSFMAFACSLPSNHKATAQGRTREALTQARGLFPFDLCELGDGVGPVAVSEDDTQLLADHFVLCKGKNSSHCWGLCTHPSCAVTMGSSPQARGAHRLTADSQRNSPDITRSLCPLRPWIRLLCLSTISSRFIGGSLICN